MTCLSEEYSAAVGDKRLFTQPLKIQFSAERQIISFEVPHFQYFAKQNIENEAPRKRIFRRRRRQKTFDTILN
jgi:hypothetical protein